MYDRGHVYVVTINISIYYLKIYSTDIYLIHTSLLLVYTALKITQKIDTKKPQPKCCLESLIELSMKKGIYDTNSFTTLYTVS